MQTRLAMYVDFHYISSRDRLVFMVGRAMDSEASWSIYMKDKRERNPVTNISYHLNELYSLSIKTSFSLL